MQIFRTRNIYHKGLVRKLAANLIKIFSSIGLFFIFDALDPVRDSIDFYVIAFLKFVFFITAFGIFLVSFKTINKTIQANNFSDLIDEIAEYIGKDQAKEYQAELETKYPDSALHAYAIALSRKEALRQGQKK